MSVSIRDAMTDPALFGTTFGGDSFASWRALLAGFYNLPLDDDEAATFKALTGRAETPQEAAHELWLARWGAGAARAMWRAFWRSMRLVSPITATGWHRARLPLPWLSPATGDRRAA